MNRLPVATILLGLLLAPMAEATLRTQAVEGASAVHLASDEALLAVPLSSADHATMQLDAASWLIDWVDDYDELAVRDPRPGSGDVFSRKDRTVTHPSPGSGGPLMLTGILDADAIALVKPLSGDYGLELTSSGSFRIDAVETKVLEHSHSYQPTGFPRHPYYYEYAVQDTLEFNATGPAQVRVEGDFQVYFWGVDLFFPGPDGSRIQTGYTSSEVVEGAGTWSGVREDHARFAVVSVSGASLVLTTSGSLQAYAQSFGPVTADSSSFTGAAGTIPTAEGDYAVHDAAVVARSSYAVSRGEGGVAVEFLGPALGVSGQSVTFHPSPLWERGGFWPAVASAALALALFAAWLAPGLAGRRQQTGLFDRPPRGLRERRAAGYARWALAAHGRAQARRAAFWMGQAGRLLPENSAIACEHGVLLRESGRPAAALRVHERAHLFLKGVPDGDLAHNAFEAAKAACQARRREAALDWLRIAVDADPYLAIVAQDEPDLAVLRDEADYQSLVGPQPQA